jgi:N-acetylglucosamine kinase-like BadF-type ATPase
MTYYLGFDGGGTKTQAAILDATGLVVGEGAAGPSNPLRTGYDAAFASLRQAGASALKAASLDANRLRAVCAALAGAGRPGVATEVKKFLDSAFPNAETCVITDFEAALEAGVGAGPGVVLIAGTGSAAFGRNSAGEVARAGGYGPWIGDAGSAFEIGRRAVAAAAQARDRGEADESFLGQILVSLCCATWDELIERVAADADQVFPSLFPAVVEAAASGDSAAQHLLEDAAASLVDLAEAVIERLHLRDQRFALAKSGGVFGRNRVLDDAVDAQLTRFAPGAKIEPLVTPPAVGAAQIARRFAAGKV